MPKFGSHASGTLATFLRARIAELSPTKTQAQIAQEAGYINQNVVSMLKNGRTKLPLDRVVGLAQGLETDPKYLFNLALAQEGNETAAKEIEAIFHAVVTKNEGEWLEALREASGATDPAITKRARATIFQIFGK